MIIAASIQRTGLAGNIGHTFQGDDAFGVEVARRLSQRELPKAVRVIDFGIRGLDLTYSLPDGYHAVILVDAAPRGGPPGTIGLLELVPAEAPETEQPVPLDLHVVELEPREFIPVG